jgi:O-antigen ligase
MLTKPEWLLLLGLILGHSVLYGKFPNQLGLRVKDAIGPGDVLFFLSFVSMITYWANQKMRPNVPKALWIAPILLFAYTTIYTYYAFAFKGIQDNALIQVVGWFYFTLALPTYLCLATGRIWKGFFAVVFLSLLVGSVFAFAVEGEVLRNAIQRMGYGGQYPRSFGDLSVRTNQLGFAVTGTLIAIVVTAFAKNGFWKYAALFGGLGGGAIILLDRGRASYAGMLVAILIVLLMMPLSAKLRVALRSITAIITAVLIVLALGGPVSEKFTKAIEKAGTAIELTSAEAITADQGLTYRQNQLRQARVMFAENPLFGAGPGVYFGQTVNYQMIETEFVAFIDNSWMYPMAIGGLMGMGLILASYGSFVCLSIWAFLRLRNPFHRALAAVPLGQMAWLLVCSPVNWWMVDRYHIAAFSVGVGMVLALVYHEKVNGSDQPVIPLGEED